MDDDDHGLSHRLEEDGQRLAQPARQAGRGEAEDDGEDDDAEDGVIGRRPDRIGRGQTGQEGRQTAAADILAHRLVAGRPGQQQARAFGIDGPQGVQPLGGRDAVEGGPDQQQGEHHDGPERQPPGRRRVGDGGDAGHQQGEDQRDDGHAQGVEPQLPQPLDQGDRAGAARNAVRLRRRACGQTGGQGQQDAQAERGEQGGGAGLGHAGKLGSAGPFGHPSRAAA